MQQTDRTAGIEKPATEPLRAPVRVNWLAAVWTLPVIVWQVLFFLVPLLLLIVMTFWSVQAFRLTPDFTFNNWINIFTADYFYRTYFRTFGNALTIAVIASVLAFPCSYTLAYHVSPAARRFAIFLLITPFFTSYLVRTYSWQVMLADGGLLNSAFGIVGIGPFHMLNTQFGTMIGYLTFFFPLVILLQLVSLSNVDRNLIEASYNLGARRMRTVFEVIIPSAKIGLIIAGVLAFILAFGDFISPSLLGGGNRPTLSILIVDTVKSASDWPRASVIAIAMVVTLITVLFIALGIAYRKRSDA